MPGGRAATEVTVPGCRHAGGESVGDRGPRRETAMRQAEWPVGEMPESLDAPPEADWGSAAFSGMVRVSRFARFLHTCVGTGEVAPDRTLSTRQRICQRCPDHGIIETWRPQWGAR